MVGDGRLIALARQQVVEDGFSAVGVGAEGDLIDVAEAAEGFNIGVVWMGGERIAEEDHTADVFG